MRRYLLDTGPLGAYLQGRQPAVDLIVPWIRRGEAATSILVYGEIMYSMISPSTSLCPGSGVEKPPRVFSSTARSSSTSKVYTTIPPSIWGLEVCLAQFIPISSPTPSWNATLTSAGRSDLLMALVSLATSTRSLLPPLWSAI